MTEPSPNEAPQAFLELQPLIEAALRHHAFPESGGVPKLHEAMCYSLFAGGKRLRPALVLLAFRATRNASTEWGNRFRIDGSGEFPDDVLAVAAAFEMVHTYSLIHDDLPAMDNDDLRRGRPTNHKVYGEATAILAGDAMLTSAFLLLAREIFDPVVSRKLIERLADASGGGGMVGGQMDDLAAEGRNDLSLEDLRWIHQRKTGQLIAAALEAGALIAGASEVIVARMRLFGGQLGQAFQIADDILDVVSSPEVLGKSIGKDEAAGKLTYPALMGLDGARQEAERVADIARSILKENGLEHSELWSLVDFVVRRAN